MSKEREGDQVLKCSDKPAPAVDNWSFIPLRTLGKAVECGSEVTPPIVRASVCTLLAEGCWREDSLSVHIHRAVSTVAAGSGHQESYRPRDTDGARWQDAGGSCQVQHGPAPVAAMHFTPIVDQTLG